MSFKKKIMTRAPPVGVNTGLLKPTLKVFFRQKCKCHKDLFTAPI